MPHSNSRPKLREIAEVLNVSVATVSNALSGKGRVSVEIAEKIREHARQLHYVPAAAGRALRTGRSYVLGLVLPDILNPLFPKIAQAVEHAAAKRGYGVLIADARSDVVAQTEAINRLIERGVDGLVVIPRRATRVSEIGKPVAVIDSPSTPGNTVAADHWQGGQLIMEHLLALGHRKFLLLGNDRSSIVQCDRIGGMKSRLPKDAQYAELWVDQIEKGQEPGRDLGLAKYFRDGTTAFACVFDLLAVRALTELLSAGITVPNDASVTGCDDLALSAILRPSLTTLRMDTTVIAETAIDALVASIEAQYTPPFELGVKPLSGPVKARAPFTDKVPMELVIRQSSAQIRSAQ